MKTTTVNIRTRVLGAVLAAVALAPTGLSGQATNTLATATGLSAEPERVVVRVGERVDVTVRVLVDNRIVSGATPRIFAAGDGIRWVDGAVEGLEVGTHQLLAVLGRGDADPLRLEIPVVVEWPAVSRVDVAATGGTLYAGTTLTHSAVARHENGTERVEPTVEWSTSDPAVATVDRFGNVTAHATGSVTVSASVEGVTGQVRHTVAPFPGTSIRVTGAPDGNIRTGDVIHVEASVIDASGSVVGDVPVSWSHSYTPPEGVFAPAAPGNLEDGAFVADWPGVFTLYANAGPLAGRVTFEVEERDVVQELEVVGHGLQNTMRTTDFWVFEGVNGRDYVLTGSKVSGGYFYVFDVTDPAAPFKTDSLQVDARTVNDVKVSPDGRYATVTREGASNRINGVVILDLADPAHPVIASVFSEGITGGVHNAFPTETHVFALSNGDKYVIIDVEDLYAPRYVSEYDHPDSRLHDVWVVDGLAYSAEWGTGIVVVDVGDGRWGGSIEDPKLVSVFPLTGSTHQVIPYYSESAGKMYLFAGDEVMNRRGKAWAGYPRSMGSYASQYDPETGQGGIPLVTSGYIQVVDFTDPENPEWVARYEVSEFGTHNIWVEDDILYQAYYEGGVRMVDVSGELRGNLYTQGREIAVFKPATPAGYTPNATMVWSAMPFKGHVWFSDTNSGIWSAKLLPKRRPIS